MGENNKWKIIGKPFSYGKNRYVKCRCICGTVKPVRVIGVNQITSTGCRSCNNGKATHRSSNDSLYKRWSGMKQRCYYSKHNEAHLYSERGIKMCNEWKKSFASFKEWALQNGYKEGLSIDRIDNNKGYNPKNCRWITPFQQNRNQRTNIVIEFNGERLILKDWCKKLNLNYDTIRYRIYSGKTPHQALGLDRAG